MGCMGRLVVSGGAELDFDADGVGEAGEVAGSLLTTGAWWRTAVAMTMVIRTRNSA